MIALKSLREGWDRAARENAMGNIVTTQRDWGADDFFAHGRAEIDAVLARLDEIGVKPKLGRALDFGCGLGRLTQALAEHFKRVDGVDISPEMVERARSHNLHPGRVEYHLNTERIPFRSGTFDLVYSMIVLQHMPATLAEGYVGEFLRVVKPKGVAVFQIPEGPDYEHPDSWLSMFGSSRAEVEGWITRAGGRLLDVETAETGQWLSCRYTAVRA